MLRPGGLFFFHTFNRNLLAWLVVIKGLEWFVRNTPERMHVLPLFIKPRELAAYCRAAGMEPREWTGMRPEVCRGAFWRMLATGRVPEDFAFAFTRSLAIIVSGDGGQERSAKDIPVEVSSSTWHPNHGPARPPRESR